MHPPALPRFEETQRRAQDLAPQILQARRSGANRLIIGVSDMVDDSSFKNLEVIAKGLGLI